MDSFFFIFLFEIEDQIKIKNSKMESLFFYQN